MNERIQELKRLCYIPNTQDVYDMEKFAELIIKQCIQELAASGRCDPYTGDLFDCEYNKCLSTQITMLSEVFEIEE